MPRGGWRPNSGRPTKEQAAEKVRLLAEAAAAGPKITPRAFLQAMLDSPGSSKAERMRSAELLMKFGPPEAPSGGSDNPPVVWNIWALPRGAQMGEDGKVVWPDGTTEPPQPVKPFEATPPLPPMPRRREPEPVLETDAQPAPFETVEPEPPQNVTALRPFERGVSFGARHDPSRRPEAADPFKFKPRT
jgi:hypothetical protein